MADHDPLTGLLTAASSRRSSTATSLTSSATAPRARCSCSTSTTSRRQRHARPQRRRPADRLDRRASLRSRLRRPTCSRASVATSSRSCCRRPMSARPSRWRARWCARSAAPRRAWTVRASAVDLGRGGDARRRSASLSADGLLVEADLAMYDAKEAGRDGYSFYSRSGHRGQPDRAAARLGQPDRARARTRSAGARRPADPRSPLGGRVSTSCWCGCSTTRDVLIEPARFLGIAERFGLVARIDQWVVRAGGRAARAAAGPAVQGQHLRPVARRRAVAGGDRRSLAAGQVDPVAADLRGHGDRGDRQHHPGAAFARRLRELGCRFALDDFGAGFGSFYYLKHLPFDYVKIDGEFVRHAARGHVDQLVIGAVVGIARGLGKETIAEFVDRRRDPADRPRARRRLRPGLLHRQTIPDRRNPQRRQATPAIT